MDNCTYTARILVGTCLNCLPSWTTASAQTWVGIDRATGGLDNYLENNETAKFCSLKAGDHLPAQLRSVSSPAFTYDRGMDSWKLYQKGWRDDQPWSMNVASHYAADKQENESVKKGVFRTKKIVNTNLFTSLFHFIQTWSSFENRSDWAAHFELKK